MAMSLKSILLPVDRSVGTPSPNISFVFEQRHHREPLFVNIFGKESLLATLYPPYGPIVQRTFLILTPPLSWAK